MLSTFRCLTAFLAWAACCGAGQEAQLFRSEVNLVNITALVRSSEGKLVPTLDKDDFQVSEDGVPQEIRFFAREARLPLSLGLIVDASGSQDKFLKQHKRDIETFLTTVLRPSDQAFAVCFGNHRRLVSDSTAFIRCHLGRPGTVPTQGKRVSGDWSERESSVRHGALRRHLLFDS